MDTKYIKTKTGTSNIIFTVSHDGNQIIPHAKKRKFGCKVRDDELQLTAETVDKYLQNKGVSATLIINDVSREIVDTNRSIYFGADGKIGRKIHKLFHEQVKEEVLRLKKEHKYVFLFDLHGQSTIDAIEVGYGLRKLNLRRLIKHKRIKNPYGTLNNRKLYDLIFSKQGIAETFINHHLKAIPNTDYIPSKRYRRGGYTVKHYAKYHNVITIQLEFSRTAREHKTKISQAMLDIINNVNDIANN